MEAPTEDFYAADKLLTWSGQQQCHLSQNNIHLALFVQQHRGRNQAAKIRQGKPSSFRSHRLSRDSIIILHAWTDRKTLLESYVRVPNACQRQSRQTSRCDTDRTYGESGQGHKLEYLMYVDVSNNSVVLFTNSTVSK